MYMVILMGIIIQLRVQITINEDTHSPVGRVARHSVVSTDGFNRLYLHVFVSESVMGIRSRLVCERYIFHNYIHQKILKLDLYDNQHESTHVFIINNILAMIAPSKTHVPFPSDNKNQGTHKPTYITIHMDQVLV